MDEGEFHLALQKDKPKQPTPSTTSLKNSLDTRTSIDSTQRRHSIASPRTPRPMSGKSVSSTDTSEPPLERPKSANNPRGVSLRQCSTIYGNSTDLDGSFPWTLGESLRNPKSLNLFKTNRPGLLSSEWKTLMSFIAAKLSSSMNFIL